MHQKISAGGGGDVLERLTAIEGAPPPPRTPPLQTKVTIVGKNEIYRWENFVGPFLLHTLLGPSPPSLPLLSSNTSLQEWGGGGGIPPRVLSGGEMPCSKLVRSFWERERDFPPPRVLSCCLSLLQLCAGPTVFLQTFCCPHCAERVCVVLHNLHALSLRPHRLR